MKKQLQSIMFCLPLLFGMDKVNAQCSLVEAPGVESQDISRVSYVNGSIMFFGREQGGSIYDVYLWSNNGTNSTKVKYMFSQTSGINGSYITPCNGKGIFFTSDGTNGYEPWVTDGTASGTFMLKNIHPSGNSVAFTQECFCSGNKLYFQAADGTNGAELWVTDGTTAGTIMLKDINTGGSSSPFAFTEYNNEVYFIAKSGSWNELWHTDGTTTGTLKMTNPAGLSRVQSGLYKHNNLLFFNGVNNSGVNGLWKTDGSTANTSLVTNSVSPANLISLGTDLIYSYSYTDPSCFCWKYKLYKSDGLTSTLIKDSIAVVGLIRLGNKIIFGGEYTSSGTGYEPWVTDGTTAGTYSLASIATGSTSSYYPLFRSVSEPFNNKIYFYSDVDLWQTDGTISGTTLKCDIRSGGPDNVGDFAIMGSDLYFHAANPGNSNRSELFKIGGTTDIQNYPNALRLNIYPQPTRETLNIEVDPGAENLELILTDITGKRLKSQTSSQVGNKIQLAVGNLSEGIYLLTIKTPNGDQCTRKVVVNR
jgi:ELWxxDGT repeat protein